MFRAPSDVADTAPVSQTKTGSSLLCRIRSACMYPSGLPDPRETDGAVESGAVFDPV